MTRALGLLLLLGLFVGCSQHPESRLSNEKYALQQLPERPRPLVELGDSFLGTGPISEGFELPTGAIWQPSLLVYGTSRTAAQYIRNRDGREVSEVVTRLDIFANFRLSGSERILVGFRPLDEDGEFLGYQFSPEDDRGYNANSFDEEITALFFEGDFGEIFPRLDPQDKGMLDIGFAIGRQGLFFQDGILINDTIDAIGLTQNNFQFGEVTNLRVTPIYGWGHIHRGNGQRDRSGQLVGLFSEADFSWATMDLDLVYVDSTGEFGSGFFVGSGLVARIGHLNVTFRANSSIPVSNQEEPDTHRGTLLLAEVSWVPTATHDNVYLTAFLGIDRFRSAARDPGAGGPLSRAGILFTGAGTGSYGSALSASADRVFGGALGYQKFFSNNRKQVVLEIGGRKNTDSEDEGAFGVAARYQQAFFSNFVLRADAFATIREKLQESYGARLELLIKF